jgi:hypothetical protein
MLGTVRRTLAYRSHCRAAHERVPMCARTTEAMPPRASTRSTTMRSSHSRTCRDLRLVGWGPFVTTVNMEADERRGALRVYSPRTSKATAAPTAPKATSRPLPTLVRVALQL